MGVSSKPPSGMNSRSRLSVGFGSSAVKPTLEGLVDKYINKVDIKLNTQSEKKPRELSGAE